LEIGNWVRALLDFVHKNFILGAIGDWINEKLTHNFGTTLN
jgi:hypothetical protein